MPTPTTSETVLYALGHRSRDYFEATHLLADEALAARIADRADYEGEHVDVLPILTPAEPDWRTALRGLIVTFELVGDPVEIRPAAYARRVRIEGIR